MRLLAALSIPVCTVLAAQDGGLQAKAEAARAELAGMLMARLQEVLRIQGHGKAIEVCRSEAPAMAEKVGRSHGVRIGRTSTKLRNPANQAPAWAGSMVAAGAAEPRFSQAPDGGLRALYPIRLGPACLACHGPESDLSPEVRSALAERYPHDQATGYRAGDLRGWFWVDVPNPKAP